MTFAPFLPRDYQWHVIESLFTWFGSHAGHPLVAMPTGTGKSVCIGGFARAALERYPGTRVMCLTHVKELIGQNADKLLLLWPQAPLGIHSAGLKQRDTQHAIIYGGIKSVANQLSKFQAPDLLLIDECHLLSPNASTMYWLVINHFRQTKPYMKVVGFTATHWRAGQGLLTDDSEDSEGKVRAALFTSVAIDMTTPEWWQWFVAQGYLVPPMPFKTDVQFNMADVGVSSGDYSLAGMNAVVDTDPMNNGVAREIVRASQGRHKKLAFCAGVEHAEHMAGILSSLGMPSRAIHSRTPAIERDRYLKAFHDPNSGLDMLTNNNVLTTGFDEPLVDYMAMIRPTVRSSLWVQMLGRGTRPCKDIMKRCCLVSDFAGNTERLGPINDPVKPKKKGKGGGGEAPVKICDTCGAYNHASARVCEYCATEFPIRPKITIEASIQELFRGDTPVYEYFPVQRVFYQAHHRKADRKQIVRVEYWTGNKPFTVYLDFESGGFRVHVAREWWRQFVGEELPPTNQDAVTYLHRYGASLTPTRVRVHVNKEHPEVVGYEYN